MGRVRSAWPSPWNMRWGSASRAQDGAQPAPKSSREAPSHPAKCPRASHCFGSDTASTCWQSIPPFIHSPSHSIFSSFVLNVYHGSVCCGDSREQGAKHWWPGSFTEWKVGQQVTCSARLGLWRCSPQCSHRLPCSRPLHLSTNTIISFSLLPQTTKVHTTKPTLFTTEPGFSFWNVGEWMLLTGTGCSR